MVGHENGIDKCLIKAMNRLKLNEFIKIKHSAVVFLILMFPGFAMAQTQPIKRRGVPEFKVDTVERKDVIDLVRAKFNFKSNPIKRVRGKKVYFSLLPVSSPVPGGGKALITSTTAGFYLGERRNTSLSNVSFSPYLNFKGRYAVSFRSNVYTSKNSFNIQGDTRFSLYPEYIYKPRGEKSDKILITYKYIRFYQNVLKRIRPYYFVGIGYNLDYHWGIKSVGDTIGFAKFTGYEIGTATNKSSVSSGITFNFLYDSRGNNINPLPGGKYVNFVYRTNPYFLGNGDNTWKSVLLDVRRYLEMPGEKRTLLAIWSYAWSALNNKVPYLDLPAIGNDAYQRSGRGIDQNRYRGKTLLYLESEYRRDLTENGLLGFVAFANLHTNTTPGYKKFEGPHAAAGTGLRIKFNKRSNTNIALDYGFSRGNSSFYLALGEAF